jgi:hypothetical protein
MRHPILSVKLPFVSRMMFVLDNKLIMTDDEIKGIMERTVTKQGKLALADVSR